MKKFKIYFYYYILFFDLIINLEIKSYKNFLLNFKKII